MAVILHPGGLRILISHMNKLAEIIEQKRKEVELIRPLGEKLRTAELARNEFRSFRRALDREVGDLAVIAEVQKASPSAGVMRKARLDKVFGGATKDDDDDDDDDDAWSYAVKNTRATIVLEHLIQASDVSHTMQHWHVDTKWNRRLFEEMNLAFKQGRMAKDPATFWYEGELGFFDNYVIPLAKKPQECHVFGVSSDEYLNYALSNRQEWEAKGQAIVQEMSQTFFLALKNDTTLDTNELLGQRESLPLY